MTNPPVCVARDHRIALEAVSFAMRAAMRALVSIRDLTDRHAIESKRDFDTDDKVELCTHAWTVVDQIHMIRNLLLRLVEPGADTPTEIADFLEKYASAKKMRDAMDHLAGNLGNVASKKGLRPPVFGCVSYIARREKREDEPGEDHVRSVAVPLGSMSHDQHSFPMAMPRGDLPAVSGLHEFHAFDQRLCLHELLADLPTLASFLDERAKANILAQAEKVSVEQGVSIDKLLERPLDFGVLALDLAAIRGSAPTDSAQ